MNLRLKQALFFTLLLSMPALGKNPTCKATHYNHFEPVIESMSEEMKCANVINLMSENSEVLPGECALTYTKIGQRIYLLCLEKKVN